MSYEDTNNYTDPISQQEAQQFADKDILVERLIGTLKEVLPEPPLRNQPLQTEFAEATLKRSKRKSKFTREQDEMIVDLKSKGKSWIDIAQITGVGSFLAARNRYQVLIGQQGVGSSVWGTVDSQNLQNLVDEGELEKWRFIAREMYKLTGKSFTDAQCRELIRELFLEDPTEFGVNEESVSEYVNSKEPIPAHIQTHNEIPNPIHVQQHHIPDQNQTMLYHYQHQHHQDMHHDPNQNHGGYNGY